jgi:putative transposase
MLKMAYRVSQRRACSTMVFARSVVRYESRADPQAALRMRLRELAMARVGYGYRRLHILLWREGWKVNHKRVYRLYRDEALGMRKRTPRRRKACLKRELRPLAVEKNECWSMDFMSDGLYDGRRIRILTLVDNHIRESLAIHVAQRIRGMEVAEVLEKGYPKSMESLERSRLTTAPSSSRRMSICGSTGITSSSTSAVPASLRTMLISSLSMPGFGWSV